MTDATIDRTSVADELSCYTANLAAYLERVQRTYRERIARSIRLAVRVDGPTLAFSHHREPLDLMPDGTVLRYRGANEPWELLHALGTEVERHGHVLVVANTAHLPWAPTFGGRAAPHWLLIDGHGEPGWRVVDRFQALLPEGEHVPFAGFLTSGELLEALTPLSSPTPEQGARDRYALGGRLSLPPGGGYRWLIRTPGRPAARAALPGGWITDELSALGYLAHRFGSGDAVACAPYLDDVWAAARHERYRCAWLLGQSERGFEPAIQELAAAWEQLPRATRFAVDSARRGRPRPAVARKAFEVVIDSHAQLKTILPAFAP